MSSATTRRVAKLEGALLPREAVLAWLAEAQQFPSIVGHARATADLPVEAAPLSVISARVVGAVREARKGQPREDVERAARRAEGDAVFLFCLVLILNVQAHETARIEGLRATATFFWMGALLGGPDGPPVSDTDARERRDAWCLWRSVVDRLTTDVRVEAEARTSLERRYLAGHDVLFADAASAWAGHVEFVERLAGLAEIIAPSEPAKTGRRKPDRSGPAGAFDTQVEALASHLADDAGEGLRAPRAAGAGRGDHGAPAADGDWPLRLPASCRDQRARLTDTASASR
jgi:hypothetical protein